MCDDSDDGPEVGKVLAMMFGPMAERDCKRFMAHIRAVVPGFAAGVDDDTLLTVYCAGRKQALEFLQTQAEAWCDAASAMTALALGEVSKAQGIDVDALNANLERAMQQREGQPKENVQ